MIRSTSLLLALALALPLAAHADDASHRAKAEEMMTLLHTERLVNQISDNIKKQISEAADKVAGPNPTPETKAKAADFVKHADDLIDAQIGWPALKAGFTDVYVKNFTEEQLDAIIAFYKTPAGIALVDNMPTVNSEITQAGNGRMSTLQPQLKQLFDQFRNSTVVPPPASIGPPVPPASLGPPVPPAAPAPSTTQPK